MRGVRLRLAAVPFFALFIFIFGGLACADSGDSRDTDSPFGMLTFLVWNHEWNDYQYGALPDVKRAVALMKEAGVGIVRLDFNWPDIEKTPGEFDFSRHDWIVDHLFENGIKVMGMLQYSPAWTGREWNDPPDSGQFARYAGRTVRHFRDRVKYWEVWNEPDVRQYWSLQDGMKAYTELLKAAYPAIKKEDHTCQVLMGGVSAAPLISLKQIYRNGGKDAFDIVNVHPFQNPRQEGAFERVRGVCRGVRKVMKEFEDDHKSLWITELGCPGVDEPTRQNGWWFGLSPTRPEQAVWAERIYTEGLKWEGVDKIFWAFFRDTDHFKDGRDFLGLIQRDFSKKPAYEAYRRAAEEWRKALNVQ